MAAQKSCERIELATICSPNPGPSVESLLTHGISMLLLRMFKSTVECATQLLRFYNGALLMLTALRSDSPRHCSSWQTSIAFRLKDITAYFSQEALTVLLMLVFVI